MVKKKVLICSLCIAMIATFASCNNKNADSSSMSDDDEIILVSEDTLTINSSSTIDEDNSKNNSEEKTFGEDSSKNSDESNSENSGKENETEEPLLDLSTSNIPDCDVNTKEDFRLTANEKPIDISKGIQNFEQSLGRAGISDIENSLSSWGLGYSGKYNFASNRTFTYGNKEFGYSSEDNNVTGLAFKSNTFPDDEDKKNNSNRNVEFAVNGVKIGMTEQEVTKVIGKNFEKIESSDFGKSFVGNNGKQVLFIDLKKSSSKKIFTVETVAVINVKE